MASDTITDSETIPTTTTTTEDMEVENPNPNPGSNEAQKGDFNPKREREDKEEESEQNGAASKKQKVEEEEEEEEEEEKSVEEERMEKLEETPDGDGGEEKEEEKKGPVSLGPKIFETSVEMFDYFYKLLHHWPLNVPFNKYETMVLLGLIKKGHPEPEKKIGTGVNAVEIRHHPMWKSRCFFVIRADESVEDFSFRKSVDHILPLPENMKIKFDVNKALGGNGKKNGGGGRGGGHGRFRGRGGKHRG